jgi:hypothetical protein
MAALSKKLDALSKKLHPIGVDLPTEVGGFFIGDIWHLWGLVRHCGGYCDNICDAGRIWARCITHHIRRSAGI